MFSIRTYGAGIYSFQIGTYVYINLYIFENETYLQQVSQLNVILVHLIEISEMESPKNNCL